MAENERKNIMNRFPAVSALIMIVAFIAAVFISREMRKTRVNMYKDAIAEARMEMKYFPVLGMDKFYSDIEWIRLIQQMGDPNITMKDDEKSRKSAEFFYQKLDKITSLSPDINKPYLIGARHISNVLPKRSVQLLEKADKLSANTEWRNYEYIAFVERQYIASKLEDEEAKRASLMKAADNYRKAMDMPEVASYVESAWLRLQANLQGLSDDDFGRLALEIDYLINKNMMSGASGDEAVEGGMDVGGMASENSELLEKIMNNAQVLAVKLWKESQTAPAKLKKELQEKHTKVREMFLQIAPKGKYSLISLRPYKAGDKFDVYTGTPVEVYGICPACKAKGVTTVTKGDYCHVCGTPLTEK